MLSKAMLQSLVPYGIFTRGEKLYQQHHVHNMEVKTKFIIGSILVEADVVSSHETQTYHVRAILSETGDFMIDSSCDCPYYESTLSPCKHVVAVLLKFIEEFDFDHPEKLQEPVKETDEAFTSLLDEYTPDLFYHSDIAEKSVDIIPHIVMDDPSSDYLKVQFKIGDHEGHLYHIQNLDLFAEAVLSHTSKKYGKYLEFTHSYSAFTERSLPVVQYLMSLYQKEDHFEDVPVYTSYSYNYFGSSSHPSLKKSLFLKGRYLDSLMDLLKEIPFYVCENPDLKDGVRYHIVEKVPEFHAELFKDEDGKGYQFVAKRQMIFSGNQKNYAFSFDTHEICLFPKDASTQALYQFIHHSDEKQHYINEKDLPRFAKYMYPALSRKVLLKNDGFDPLDYTPAKPSFEIYLDAPTSTIITARLMAVYPDNSQYNLLEKAENDAKRDTQEEMQMYQTLQQYLPEKDEEKNILVLSGNDETIYAFLKDGIPFLQSKAALFISDRLKKMTIKAAPKVNVGVSVNHDLLQLNFVSDSLSLDELADILSKYDLKKRFYRLKNGSFIDLDENMDELAKMTSSLSLSKSDIVSGEAEVPKFRALYLDELAENNRYDLDRNDDFRHFIQQIHDVDSTEYDTPSTLNATLRPYQLDGFRWLCALRDNGFGGLLADEMGLGKTLQVITMLGEWKDRGRTLIVCPASLVYNWASEIKHFMPSLSTCMIQGSAEERKQLILSSRKDDILITSYDLLKRDIENYEDIKFCCEVIDEAQYIKNASTQSSKAVKAIDAGFKVALTGTPIENRLSELWSIFDYLMPGFFHSYQEFRRSYELPIVVDQDSYVEEELTRFITPFVLRRNKKDVLKDLPEKLEEVYYAPLDGEQKRLYDARVQNLKHMLENQDDKKFREDKIAVLAELTRLRQICCDPSLVYEGYQENSAKADMCIDLILNAVAGGHKVLLFSQFTSMLDRLTKRLAEENVAYYLLEGSTKSSERQALVEKFQTDDVPVFCISLKAGGTGLNLTAADIVIHYDPWWNTAVENQASDRAHRIGQKNVVSVYRLIMKDTIEERILALQEEKSDLAGRVLSGEGISSSKLSREDLLALL